MQPGAYKALSGQDCWCNMLCGKPASASCPSSGHSWQARPHWSQASSASLNKCRLLPSAHVCTPGHWHQSLSNIAGPDQHSHTPIPVAVSALHLHGSALKPSCSTFICSSPPSSFEPQANIPSSLINYCSLFNFNLGPGNMPI